MVILHGYSQDTYFAHDVFHLGPSAQNVILFPIRVWVRVKVNTERHILSSWGIDEEFVYQ